MEAYAFVKGVLQGGKIHRTWSKKWIVSDFNHVLKGMSSLGWAKMKLEM